MGTTNILMFLKMTHLKYSTMKQTVEDLFVLLVVAGMCVLAALFVQFLKGVDGYENAL